LGLLYYSYEAVFLHPRISINKIVPWGADTLLKSPSMRNISFMRVNYHRHELFVIVYSDTGINVAAQKHASEAEGVL
jgi:hypothetical protein